MLKPSFQNGLQYTLGMEDGPQEALPVDRQAELPPLPRLPGFLIRLVALQEIELSEALVESVADHEGQEHGAHAEAAPLGVDAALVEIEAAAVGEPVDGADGSGAVIKDGKTQAAGG